MAACQRGRQHQHGDTGGSGRFTAFAGQPLSVTATWPFRAWPRTAGRIYLATHVPISPLTAWLGLKNSDDVGLRVDVLAEVFRNETLIASGQLGDQSTGSSGFNNARLKAIPRAWPGQSSSPRETISA
jgi:hypothetical protein